MLKSYKTIFVDRFNDIIKNQNKLNALHQNRLSTIQNETDDQEQTNIINWLSKLSLLYGIPFSYLVADEKLLPTESIRFFYLDENWITALIDAAYSLGRANDSDTAHDNIFIDYIKDNAKKLSRIIRHKTFRNNKQALDNQKIDNSAPPIVTGFLLRSQAVSNWPGLEIDGCSDTSCSNADCNNKLTMLRMDHLSPDILICLFDGEVNCVKFHTPSEGLHFGFDITENNNSYIKTLKIIDSSNLAANGNILQVQGKNVDIPISSNFYRDSTNNVLNIAALASSIQTTLQNSGKAITDFTSAEFALEMIQGVDMAVLNNLNNNS